MGSTAAASGFIILFLSVSGTVLSYSHFRAFIGGTSEGGWCADVKHDHLAYSKWLLHF